MSIPHSCEWFGCPMPLDCIRFYAGSPHRIRTHTVLPFSHIYSYKTGRLLLKQNLFPFGQSRVPDPISLKVCSMIWIFTIFFITCLLFEHRKFHVFFHPMLFTIKIVIVGTIPCIGNRILWITSISFMILLHQWNKTFHVGCVWFYIHYCNVFITDRCLEVIGRKQLIISHGNLFFNRIKVAL